MKSLQERLKSIGVSGELPKLTKAIETIIEALVAKAENNAETPSEDSGKKSPQDEDWQDWVLSQFREDELVVGEDGKKRPRVNGLRRLTEKLIGPVVRSESRIIKAPSPDSLSATVEHSIEIIVDRLSEDLMCDGRASRHYTDVADVSSLNTDDDFLRFPASVAATRAEARCLRKALYLYSVPAEEELTTKTAASVGMDWKPDDMISEAQINGINVLCKRLDINVEELLKLGEVQYPDIKMMPKASASKLLAYLNGLQQGKPIPDTIRGYKEGWKK